MAQAWSQITPGALVRNTDLEPDGSGPAQVLAFVVLSRLPNLPVSTSTEWEPASHTPSIPQRHSRLSPNNLKILISGLSSGSMDPVRWRDSFGSPPQAVEAAVYIETRSLGFYKDPSSGKGVS